MSEQRALTSAICNLQSAFALALCALMTACAAPSPPQPPSLELPTPVTDLKAERKGNTVLLTWTLPQRTTDGEGIRFLGPTRICRSLSLGKLTDCGTPAAELTSSQLETTNAKPAANAPQRITARYADPLPPSWTKNQPAAQATYAIESLNTSHRGAGLSNLETVPAASTQPPPTEFAAQLTAEGVVLTWSGPLLSIPGTDNVPHYFYRVFRYTKDAPQPVFVGELLQGTQDKMRLVDTTFAWEKTYDYRINVTTRLTTGPPHACPGESSPLPACKDAIDIPGEDSAPVTVVAHDTFPPNVPTALQAVFSGDGQKPFIDLIWNANTDADLAGYNVYRRNATGQPTKINADLVKAPAFRDTNVAPAQTYVYSITAVDARNNESPRSEEATEQDP